MTPVTVPGSHGHDVPVTLHGGIAFSLASHYATAVKLAFDHSISTDFSSSDTISASGHVFVAEMGATIQGGSIHAAEGNATLLGSGSNVEFSGVLFKGADGTHPTGVDTVFGGVVPSLTAGDLGSVAANLVTIFAHPASESIGGAVHSVSGGSAISLGNNATINFIDPHQVASHIIKLG